MRLRLQKIRIDYYCLFQKRFQSQSYPGHGNFFNEGILNQQHDPCHSNIRNLHYKDIPHYIKALIQNDRREMKLTEIDDWKKFSENAIFIPTRAGPLWMGEDDPRCAKLIARREKLKNKPGQIARREITSDPVVKLERHANRVYFTTSTSIHDPISVVKGLHTAGMIRASDMNYMIGKIRYRKRSPIIAIIGHKGHGKTSFLDFIRNTNVSLNEPGNMTQSLDVSSFETNSAKFIFIDTPGHWSFSAMCEAALSICDMAVIVVSALDGVEEQTMSAIELTRIKHVPVIVAISKCDKNHDLSVIKEELRDVNLDLQDDGGDIPCIPFSSKTGEGIEKLLSELELQAEIVNVREPFPSRSELLVIESKAVAKNEVLAIVKCGVLKPYMSFVSGLTHGTIKSFYNEFGEEIMEAHASDIVRFTGFPMLPKPGNVLLQVSGEDHAIKFHLFMKDVYKAEGSRETFFQVLNLETQNNIYDRKPDNNNLRVFRSIPFNLFCKAESFGKLQALLNEIYALPIIPGIHLIVKITEVGGLKDAEIAIAGGTNMPGALMVYGTCRDEYFMSIPSYLHVIRFNVLEQGIQELKAAIVSTLPQQKKTRVLASAVCLVASDSMAFCLVTKGVLTQSASSVQVIRKKKNDFCIVTEGFFKDMYVKKSSVNSVERGLECVISMNDDFIFNKGDIINEVEHYTESREIETEFVLAGEVQKKMKENAERNAKKIL